MCCYNLTLFDSFFLPFGDTGMEGKLDWTEDLVQFARILEAWIEISNRHWNSSQSKFPMFPLDLNNLPVGSRKYFISNLCSYKIFSLCVKKNILPLCGEELLLDQAVPLFMVWPAVKFRGKWMAANEGLKPRFGGETKGWRGLMHLPSKQFYLWICGGLVCGGNSSPSATFIKN